MLKRLTFPLPFFFLSFQSTIGEERLNRHRFGTARTEEDCREKLEQPRSSLLQHNRRRRRRPLIFWAFATFASRPAFLQTGSRFSTWLLHPILSYVVYYCILLFQDAWHGGFRTPGLHHQVAPEVPDARALPCSLQLQWKLTTLPNKKGST
jgi:hypothetical protein